MQSPGTLLSRPMAYRDADVEIDFLTDWIAIVRFELTSRGYTPPVDGEQACFAFFNLRKRSILPARRIAHESTTLACPPELNVGYRSLRSDVESGADLTPRLSRKLTDISFDDDLLNDWGIHHLHLGTELESDGFLRRTGPVLFARFTKSDAYFITIQSHGTWADIQILEEFARSWPAAAKPFEIPGMLAPAVNPTSAEIKATRRAGVQEIISVNGKAMMPMGGGITSARTGVDVVVRSDRVRNQLKRFEETVIANKSAMFARAETNNVRPSRPVRLRLTLDPSAIAYAIGGDDKIGCCLGPLAV